MKPQEVARRVPVDRTAARVTAEGPRGVESSKRIVQVCSPTPLALRRVPPDTFDLSGAEVGWLAVIGLCLKTSNNGAIWLCRCRCGYYVTRRAKSIKNASNDIDRCDRCRQTRFLQRTTQFRELGYNADEVDR